MSDTKLPIVARRLREARLRAGISQKALGIAAQIDEFSASPRINQYERNKHLPDLTTLKSLGLVLNVPLAYFFTEDEVIAEILLTLHSMSENELRKIRDLLKLESNKNL